MATKIRLRRMGAKKAPFYRVVVADSRSPRDGRFIEEIGYYDPTKNPSVIKIDEERAKYWMGVGAQPSDTVRALFAVTGIVAKSVARQAGKPKPAAAQSAAPEATAAPAEAAPEKSAAPEETAAPEEAAASEAASAQDEPATEEKAESVTESTIE